MNKKLFTFNFGGATLRKRYPVEKYARLVKKFPKKFRMRDSYLSMCAMHIGNDTGTMHVAAAEKIPILEQNPFPAFKFFDDRSVPLIYHPYNVPTVIFQVLIHTV